MNATFFVIVFTTVVMWQTNGTNSYSKEFFAPSRAVFVSFWVKLVKQVD